MTFPINSRVGIGLRSPHIEELMCGDPVVSWLEVHSENWFAEAGPIAQKLEEIRSRFDLSLHGVGLSIGSADGIDAGHLRRLKALVERCNPILISEHLSWGSIDGRHSNDLLPMPYTESALQLLIERVDFVQQALGRKILIENLSSYCQFSESTMPEWVFVRALAEAANCGILLDVNNVYVNASNHGFNPEHYLNAMPWERVDEVHLAGYDTWEDVLVDTHGNPVQAPVWDLFHRYQHQLSPATRILIEWDNDLPDLATLLVEAHKASELLGPVGLKESHDA
jgi:uncharacterized protein (UPF0276 family)